ncbi:PilW family protein [Chloroflexota bacterium]
MKQQRGFTLVELVLGLAIGGAVVAVIGMTITTLLLNYQEPTIREILLQQVHNAGFQMMRDINMSSDVYVGDQNGFPFIVNIPVDQNEDNDYHVDYLFDDDKLKRQQFDSLDIMTVENVIASYVDTDNTHFENTEGSLYKMTIQVYRGGESVTVSYDMERRLTSDD